MSLCPHELHSTKEPLILVGPVRLRLAGLNSQVQKSGCWYPALTHPPFFTLLSIFKGIRLPQRDRSSRSSNLHGLLALLLIASLWLGAARTVYAIGDQNSAPKIQVETVHMPIVDGMDLRYNLLSTRDGLSQSKISQITQDDQGFMWFSTQVGLNRYDGYSVKLFVHDPGDPRSLSGVQINALFKDRDGTLWVGCDQFLNKFDPATETFTRYPIPTIKHISQDGKGLLWLSTPDGLYSLNPVSGTIRRFSHDPDDPSSLSSSRIYSSGEDKAGRFWVSDAKGLDEFNRDNGKAILRIPFQDPSQQFSFYEDRLGTFWIFDLRVSRNSLATFDPRTNKLTYYSFHERGLSTEIATEIIAMVEDANGTLWLATHGDGLLEFDRNHRQFIRYRNKPGDLISIPQNNVENLFRDHEGSIWAGLGRKGLLHFSTKPQPFASIPQLAALNGSVEPFVGAIFEDHRGVLWIGTPAALNEIDQRDEQYMSYRRTDKTVSNTDVITIREDRTGNLWVGTYGHGLLRFDRRTGHFQTFVHDPADPYSLSSDIVTRLLVDHNGTLWVATYDGLDRFDAATGRFTVYRANSHESAASYLELVEDQKGSYWLGTEFSGLSRFDPTTGHFTNYRQDMDRVGALSDNRVNSVHFDHSGTMWVGTQNGLDRFDPKTESFTVYTHKNGLPGNAVGCILEDDGGNLWLSTNNGIAQFDPRSTTVKSYSMADGLSGSDLTGWGACIKRSNGEMLFGGFGGATAFDPRRVVADRYTPPVVLTNFRLFGTEVAPGSGSVLEKTINQVSGLTLTHEQNIFSIGFSGLSYMNPTSIRYRYRLEGLDQSWNEVGSSQRAVSFDSLPSGKYTFRVQAATGDGPWGEAGATLNIRILPAWWNTWWFRTVYLAALVLAISLAYLVHMDHIASEHNIRLEERLRERTRISRELHDTLLQGFQGLSLRFQAVMNALPGDSAARELIEDALDRADQVLLEARRSVRELREDPLSDGDLADSLARCGEMLAQGHAITFRLFVIGKPRPLSPTACNEAFRLGREGLVNAFRHSQAGKIQVEITYRNHGVRLIIRDDGIGVDQKTLNGGLTDHWGLSGMRERALRIGGTLKLWSRPGAGTEIDLTIPAEMAYRPEPKRSPWYRPSLFATRSSKETDGV